MQRTFLVSSCCLLHQFSISVVTNYYKFSNSNNTHFLCCILQDRSLTGLKLRCWQDRIPFWRLQGRSCFLALSSFQRSPHSLACDPLPPSSTPATNASFSAFLSLLHTLLTASCVIFLKGACDYHGLAQILQDNHPTSRFFIESHL